MKKIVTALLACVVCPTFAQPHMIQKHPVKPSWYNSHLDLGGYYREDPHFLGQADAFLPLFQNANNLLFADLRGVMRSGATHEENYGVGYRQILPGQKWLWGAYGFFDRKRSETAHYFNQFTLGAELKSVVWDANVNAYIPVGETSFPVASLNTVQIRPSGQFYNIFVSQGFERSLGGVDGEVGHTLPHSHNNLRAYIGGYYYHRNGMPTIAGPRIRATYDVYFHGKKRILGLINKVTLEAMARHDNVMKTTYYAGGRVRLDFGNPHHLRPLQEHMTDYVRRDLDIITETERNGWERVNHEDGSPYTFDIIESAEQLQNNPADVLAVWSDLSNVPTLYLKPGQMLTGGDCDFDYHGHSYHLIHDTRGSLTGLPGQDLVVLSQDNGIEHIDLNVAEDNAWHYSIKNMNYASVGDLNIHDIDTNGAVDIEVENAASRVRFYNNIVWMPNDPESLPVIAATVNIYAGNHADMSVDAFYNNVLMQNAFSSMGFLARVSEHSTLTFTNGIHDNWIATGNHFSQAVTLDTIANDAVLTVSGGIKDNTIATYGFSSDGWTNNTYGPNNKIEIDSVERNEFSTNYAESKGLLNILDGVNSQITIGRIDQNRFSGNDMAEVGLMNMVNGNHATLTIDSISSNDFTFTGEGGAQFAMRNEMHGNSGTMNLNNVEQNVFNMKDDVNFAMFFYAGEGVGNHLNVSNLNGNIINYALDSEQTPGMLFLADGINNHIRIDGMYGNAMTSSDNTTAYLFGVENGINSDITVNVNYNGQDFEQANGVAPYIEEGNVIISD